MPTHNTKNPSGTKTDQPDQKVALPKDEERDRLRDIIVVIVTYPLTPNEKTDKLAKKKPWLEFTSLLLKVLLALYAIYEAMSK
ncbi:hypothetical protein GGR28_003020 [Lewinella aquimaris]|uniref:Uncharacterized protein n=1 Tax=Neolewinella aquimaris TaxID=1835722 RepID=A0A840EHL0_9BACT|nr:hypothetical protein [Neolewinella aquimaris]MBB4080386.1 hypothetical protein [Neolewinella aquimaris]